MRARFFNCFFKSRVAWLLGLLLLMPLAQTAATWHLASHTHVQSSQSPDDKSAALVDYCDLCRTAVATTGGLLPTPAGALVALAAPPAVPLFTFQPTAHKPLWPPYASRAPPFALI